MAFKIQFNELNGIIFLMLFGIPLISSTNIDCGGKPFLCVNSTHFRICVDLGGGVSTTVDDYIIPCPPTTTCERDNRFECEFPTPTTSAPIYRTSNVTNELELSATTLPWEDIFVTTIFPPNNTTRIEHSDLKNFNTVSLTTPSGSLSDLTTEANINLLEPVNVNVSSTGTGVNTTEPNSLTTRELITTDTITFTETAITIDNVTESLPEIKINSSFNNVTDKVNQTKIDNKRKDSSYLGTSTNNIAVIFETTDSPTTERIVTNTESVTIKNTYIDTGLVKNYTFIFDSGINKIINNIENVTIITPTNENITFITTATDSARTVQKETSLTNPTLMSITETPQNFSDSTIQNLVTKTFQVENSVQLQNISSTTETPKIASTDFMQITTEVVDFSLLQLITEAPSVVIQDQREATSSSIIVKESSSISPNLQIIETTTVTQNEELYLTLNATAVSKSIPTTVSQIESKDAPTVTLANSMISESSKNLLNSQVIATTTTQIRDSSAVTELPSVTIEESAINTSTNVPISQPAVKIMLTRVNETDWSQNSSYVIDTPYISPANPVIKDAMPSQVTGTIATQVREVNQGAITVDGSQIQPNVSQIDNKEIQAMTVSTDTVTNEPPIILPHVTDSTLSPTILPFTQNNLNLSLLELQTQHDKVQNESQVLAINEPLNLNTSITSQQTTETAPTVASDLPLKPLQSTINESSVANDQLNTSVSSQIIEVTVTQIDKLVTKPPIFTNISEIENKTIKPTVSTDFVINKSTNISITSKVTEVTPSEPGPVSQNSVQPNEMQTERIVLQSTVATSTDNESLSILLSPQVTEITPTEGVDFTLQQDSVIVTETSIPPEDSSLSTTKMIESIKPTDAVIFNLSKVPLQTTAEIPSVGTPKYTVVNESLNISIIVPERTTPQTKGGSLNPSSTAINGTSVQSESETISKSMTEFSINSPQVTEKVSTQATDLPLIKAPLPLVITNPVINESTNVTIISQGAEKKPAPSKAKGVPLNQNITIIEPTIQSDASHSENKVTQFVVSTESVIEEFLHHTPPQIDETPPQLIYLRPTGTPLQSMVTTSSVTKLFPNIPINLQATEKTPSQENFLQKQTRITGTSTQSDISHSNNEVSSATSLINETLNDTEIIITTLPVTEPIQKLWSILPVSQTTSQVSLSQNDISSTETPTTSILSKSENNVLFSDSVTNEPFTLLPSISMTETTSSDMSSLIQLDKSVAKTATPLALSYVENNVTPLPSITSTVSISEVTYYTNYELRTVGNKHDSDVNSTKTILNTTGTEMTPERTYLTKTLEERSQNVTVKEATQETSVLNLSSNKTGLVTNSQNPTVPVNMSNNVSEDVYKSTMTDKTTTTTVNDHSFSNLNSDSLQHVLTKLETSSPTLMMETPDNNSEINTSVHSPVFPLYDAINSTILINSTENVSNIHHTENNIMNKSVEVQLSSNNSTLRKENTSTSVLGGDSISPNAPKIYVTYATNEFGEVYTTVALHNGNIVSDSRTNNLSYVTEHPAEKSPLLNLPFNLTNKPIQNQSVPILDQISIDTANLTTDLAVDNMTAQIENSNGIATLNVKNSTSNTLEQNVHKNVTHLKTPTLLINVSDSHTNPLINVLLNTSNEQANAAVNVENNSSVTYTQTNAKKQLTSREIIKETSHTQLEQNNTLALNLYSSSIGVAEQKDINRSLDNINIISTSTSDPENVTNSPFVQGTSHIEEIGTPSIATLKQFSYAIDQISTSSVKEIKNILDPDKTRISSTESFPSLNGNKTIQINEVLSTTTANSTENQKIDSFLKSGTRLEMSDNIKTTINPGKVTSVPSYTSEATVSEIKTVMSKSDISSIISETNTVPRIITAPPLQIQSDAAPELTKINFGTTLKDIAFSPEKDINSQNLRYNPITLEEKLFHTATSSISNSDQKLNEDGTSTLGTTTVRKFEHPFVTTAINTLKSPVKNKSNSESLGYLLPGVTESFETTSKYNQIYVTERTNSNAVLMSTFLTESSILSKAHSTQSSISIPKGSTEYNSNSVTSDGVIDNKSVLIPVATIAAVVSPKPKLQVNTLQTNNKSINSSVSTASPAANDISIHSTIEKTDSITKPSQYPVSNTKTTPTTIDKDVSPNGQSQLTVTVSNISQQSGYGSNSEPNSSTNFSDRDVSGLPVKASTINTEVTLQTEVTPNNEIIPKQISSIPLVTENPSIKHFSQVPSNIPVNKRKIVSTPSNSFCVSRPTGRYADNLDCRKFYICSGIPQSIVGLCPLGTVFSEIKKQCTKNLSHCVRGNQFKCTSEGRFSDYLRDNVFYICVKNTQQAFVRFKFQCQQGYYLNKTTVRCLINVDSLSQSSADNTSISTVEKKSMEESKSVKKDDKKFKCEEEGKFPDPSDCRKYYVCTKNKNAEIRRRKKKCDMDEVFHKEKKKCVDADSYEC